MSEKKVKEYAHDGLTIVWQPELCIHAGNCARGLKEVFRPKERPWINVEGSTKERIMEQIKQCPSGALSYYAKEESTTEADNAITKVDIMADGPMLVQGAVEIKLADGQTVSKVRTTAFCRCGASENKPYCDGAHRKVNFKG